MRGRALEECVGFRIYFMFLPSIFLGKKSQSQRNAIAVPKEPRESSVVDDVPVLSSLWRAWAVARLRAVRVYYGPGPDLGQGPTAVALQVVDILSYCFRSLCVAFDVLWAI